jgi:hypothetical protein
MFRCHSELPVASGVSNGSSGKPSRIQDVIRRSVIALETSKRTAHALTPAFRQVRPGDQRQAQARRSAVMAIVIAIMEIAELFRCFSIA